MTSRKKQMLRGVTWVVGLPLLMIAGLMLPFSVGDWAVAIVQGLTKPDQEAEAEQEFARYKADIAARGGYIVMHAGAAIYHLPAYGSSCSVGRDRRSFSLNLDLPTLAVSQQNCEAPYVRADRALVQLSEYSTPFKPLPGQEPVWLPPPLRAGEQHFEQCSFAEAQADKMSRCSRLVGVSSGGVRYDGYCPSGTFCSLRASVAGLDADFHLYPAQRDLIGALVDRLDGYIRSHQVQPPHG
jgi:hypothetical protein